MSSSSPASSRSPAPVRLRELRPADRAPLDALLRATGSFPENELAVAMELIDEGLAKATAGATLTADDYRFLVAELPESGAAPRVIGYVCWGQNPMSDCVFDLYWIAVDPRAQGGGAGRALMAAAEAEARARGGRMVLVETGGKASYAPTRRFYERIGYVEIARLPDYFRVGDDKVIYARRLDGRPLPPSREPPRTDSPDAGPRS